MQNRTFKLGLIQMRVKGGCKAENLQRAINFVRQAATQEAQVVVLPEAMTLGWTHPSAATEADGVPDGQSCLQLRRVARENKVCLCSGLVEREGRRIFNSAVLIDPNGDVLLHHRKINELEIGHPYYALGDRLQVAHTPFGTFGLMICADGFAHGQVITRTLGYMGAEIILSPSAWAVPANHDNEREPVRGDLAGELRACRAGFSNVDRRRQQCRLAYGGPMGREEMHRLHIGRERIGRACLARTLWRRCRNDSLCRCAIGRSTGAGDRLGEVMAGESNRNWNSRHKAPLSLLMLCCFEKRHNHHRIALERNKKAQGVRFRYYGCPLPSDSMRRCTSNCLSDQEKPGVARWVRRAVPITPAHSRSHRFEQSD